MRPPRAASALKTPRSQSELAVREVPEPALGRGAQRRRTPARLNFDEYEYEPVRPQAAGRRTKRQRAADAEEADEMGGANALLSLAVAAHQESGEGK